MSESRGDLTPKQALFVQEYLVDMNATQAATRAGYSQDTAGQIGHELLKKPEIQDAIAAAQAERAARTEITQDMVLKELWAIATANPNDIVQFRRGACPDCWPKPIEEAISEEMEGQAHGGALKRRKKAQPFVSNREPNPDCTACAGEGYGRAFIIDTRGLEGPNAKLYAGVKVGKDGIEVKMHDKLAALTKVGQHLGMFTDKVDLTAKMSVGLSINGPDADL